MAYKTNIEQLLDEIRNTVLEAHQPGTVVLIDEIKKFTGPFYALTALTDCVIDVSECNTNIIEKGTGATTQAIATNISVIQGMTIYGNFESIELASGSAMAYTRSNTTVTVEA